MKTPDLTYLFLPNYYKIALFTLSFLGGNLYLKAQNSSLSLDWAITFPTNSSGSGYSELPKVVEDGEGGVFYCGSFYESHTSLLIIHFNPDGQELWRDTIKEILTFDLLAGAFKTEDNQLVVGVYHESKDHFSVIRYNREGDRVWELTYPEAPTPEQDYWRLKDVLDDGQGHYYLLASIFNYDTLNTRALVTLKINAADGRVIWKNELVADGEFIPLKGRILDDRLEVLAAAAAPRRYVIQQMDFEGNTLGTAENDYPSQREFNDWVFIGPEGEVYLGRNARGYVVTKVSSSGDTLWTFEEPSVTGMVEISNRLVGITIDEYGYLYVTGPFRIGDELIHLLTTKLDANGDKVWQKSLGPIDGEGDLFPKLMRRIEDQIYIVGGLSSKETGYSYFILAYNFSGDTTFLKTYDVGQDFELASSFAKGNECLFVTGYSYDSFPNYNRMQSILKYNIIDTNTSTLTPETEALDFLLFPNPATSQVTINTPHCEAEVIRVWTLTGRLVLSLTKPSLPLSLDIRHWPRGCYLVELRSQQGNFIRKLIRQ